MISSYFLLLPLESFNDPSNSEGSPHFFSLAVGLTLLIPSNKTGTIGRRPRNQYHRIKCDNLTVVIRVFPESLSFPQFPPFTDNGHTSLVIAFSYYLHQNFLTISQFSDNELLQQRQYMSKRI